MATLAERNPCNDRLEQQGREPLLDVRVTAEYHIAVAHRAARDWAARLGARRTLALEFATAVSELAANLVFHATAGGHIELVALRHEGRRGIEVCAHDEGPGIADLDAALCDGFSTNGGLGCGLPGARRLTDELTIASTPGRGTRVVARVWW
jgi:serine/threonine-protein kinase RsbT